MGDNAAVARPKKSAPRSALRDDALLFAGSDSESRSKASSSGTCSKLAERGCGRARVGGCAPERSYRVRFERSQLNAANPSTINPPPSQGTATLLNATRLLLSPCQCKVYAASTPQKGACVTAVACSTRSRELF